MKKVILSMQMSLDGFIEGPAGEMDWIVYDDEEQWANLFSILESVDLIVVGAGMYPGYVNHWRSVLSNPDAPSNQVKYSRLAENIQHIVFSKTLDRIDPMAPKGYDGGWKKNTSIMKGEVKEEMLKLKQQSGKNILLFGGASLAKSFINLGLIDEYRLVMNQLILGKGKRFFYNINQRHGLKLITGTIFKSGATMLYYRAI